VVWRGEVATTLTAAVVSEHEGKQVVPDQTSYFVSTNSGLEAHYLCALLNSLPIRAHYKMRGYKHVSMSFVGTLDISAFVVGSVLHSSLSDLSQQAHAATAAGEAARVREIEAEIDRLAAKLWGLTEAELQEIQESLAELG